MSDFFFTFICFLIDAREDSSDPDWERDAEGVSFS
jgi:hypothetical protein